MIELLDGASSGGTGVGAYGPIVIATAGLITALIAALNRRDSSKNMANTNLDARTNTALRGLESYADRVEKDRDRLLEESKQWQQRAETAEARVDDLEDRIAQLEDRPRTPPSQPSASYEGL